MINLPRKILYSPATLFVAAARVSASLLLIFNPFWGIIFHFITDLFDGAFLNLTLKLSVVQYHKIDKVLDEFGSVCMVISGWRFGFFWPLVALFLFRLIGSYLFFKTEKRTYFVLFPNFLEPIYFIAVSLRSIGIIFPPQGWVFWLAIFAAQAFRDFWIHFLVPKYIYWLLEDTLFAKVFLAKENARTS